MGKVQFLGRRHLFQLAPLMIACGAVIGGCGGTSDKTNSNGDNPDMGTAGAGTGGAGGSSSGDSTELKPQIDGADPARVGIHRLNNTEYDDTVVDLLGTTLQPAANFLAEEGISFDNIASALGMTAPQYEAYYNAAKDLADDVFSKPDLTARIMTCTPSVADDPCAAQIIRDFGMRAFRRPVTDTEVASALQVYDAELGRSQDGTAAMHQVVQAMLASTNFLYRVELDPDPNSVTVHPLGGYELASRLSYLQWNTMPDDALFQLAASGDLLKSDVLDAQIDRMLASPKVGAFVESFAGQWLNIRALITHSITPSIFPTYTNDLRDAMMQESYLWFYEFLSQDRDMNQWFTADFNYVNTSLAQHYGFDPPAGSDSGFIRVENTTDKRAGFLGLASFLTQTSFPSRTSPPKRAAWILSELLCAPSPQPPPNIPKLDDPNDTAAPAPEAENVRQRLEAHRADATCATCHNLLDPIGLGLENYDGIGRYRDNYGNGDPVDASGTLPPPGSQSFNGLTELSQILGSDPRFLACVSKKVFTYALGREVLGSDAPYLDQIKTNLASRGQTTFRNLIKEVVLSDTFRFRHGEIPQP